MTQGPDREKALELALAQIEKSHGKGSVMRLGDEIRQPISVIPTGSIALDVALGIGGLPRGRVVEIYGPESSGKTTVALHAVASSKQNCMESGTTAHSAPTSSLTLCTRRPAACSHTESTTLCVIAISCTVCPVSAGMTPR